MRAFAALAIALMAALPAAGETVLSEVSGNWAGSSGQGFTFLARLTQNEDKARLTIWGGGPGSAATADEAPQFDNDQFALGAFATTQELQVQDTGDASILEVVIEYADEEGSGRTVTQVQFIDNQFTVVGFFHAGEHLDEAFECDVDLWNMTATENGQLRKLDPVGFEALNASDWTWDAPYERGFCARG